MLMKRFCDGTGIRTALKKLVLWVQLPPEAFRDVAQLVEHSLWERAVARSSRVIPT